MTATASTTATGLQVRDATPADAEDCGRIFYDAFASIASHHSFPTEPASPEFTRWRAQSMLDAPGFHGLVAERDGRIVGGLFLDERATIVGVGPVVVDPAHQDAGAGRTLMEAALERERARDAAGVRLVQTAYHYRSFALYAKLGFEVRELLTVVQGDPPSAGAPERQVRPATKRDLGPCAEVCTQVHGHERSAELSDAIDEGTAAVVEHGGRMSGYCTGLGYGWHAVAEGNDDIRALLASGDRFAGLGLLVPSRNRDLLGWCLAQGLRIVQQSVLMTIGAYREPEGAYLPSILF